MDKKYISSIIDHTLLAPDAKVCQVEKLCDEAIKYNFASVCINPCFIPVACKKLKASDVKVCTVVGFPLGAMTPSAKSYEAGDAVLNGADEVDMVINVSAAKEGRFEDVEKDIKGVVEASKKAGKSLNKKIIVKVILETCYLDDDEIVECCKKAVSAGADFVKTSTGFAILKDKDGKLLPNGATVHAVEIMRKTVGPDFGVKASGGIRDGASAVAMINAGANRIGTSSGVKIMESDV